MIRGERAGLRVRLPEDVPLLHEELYNDVETRSRSDIRPWRPLGPDKSPFAVRDTEDDTLVDFSAVDLATGDLAGVAVLWGIDTHARSAHIGMSLRPAARGRGLATDIVRTLCHYAFETRGLNRVALETLSDNLAMRAVAKRVGFTHEGTLRNSFWANGRFHNDELYGLLASEWRAR
ncbi:GNAT family N-acetyltransferase [Actinomadura rupiterrae]|uniref:GNAT family N-acetyltransferase n=1 Tax=Actinomadura rupiterrae TaxID=559627 RepID=UPI0020A38A4A|nr:GNAT family protein [Actinomadura rupiterrae]MCP2337825.1 RimJ/RimL family protein N-acetyltransferase [Actinomadura rupiterrae]